jgi:hypothetical protein
MKKIAEFASVALKQSGTLVVMCAFHQWNQYIEYCEGAGLKCDKSPLFVVDFPKHNRLVHNKKSMNNMMNCVCLIAHKTMGKEMLWNAKGPQHFIEGRYFGVDNIIENYHYEEDKQVLKGSVVRYEEKGVDLFKELMN